jgi:hypothetical protein
MPQDFAPDSYWQAVKDRMSGLAAMPGNAVRGAMQQIGQGAVMNPNARPSAVANPDALPAEANAQMDPLQKQQMIQALMQQRAAQQGAPQGQPADQRQLILQEAQRRGIPVPPDSPLLQGDGGQVSPDNPAGIQF